MYMYIYMLWFTNFYNYFSAIDADDDETVAMIKELLETRIRYYMYMYYFDC